MEQFNKIKVLYIVWITLSVDLLWNFLDRILFRESYNYKLLFVLLFSAFIMSVLINKVKNKYLAMGIIFIVTFPFYFSSPLNVIPLGALLYLVLAIKIEDFIFTNIKYHLERNLAIIFAVGLLDTGRNIREYVILLIISILLLRESRIYTYQINTSKYGNILIAFLTALLSIDKVFLQFVFITKKIIQILWIPISYLVYLFLYLFYQVFSFLIGFFIRFLHINKAANLTLNVNNGAATPNKMDNIQSVYNSPFWLKTSFEIVVVLFLVYIIYTIYKPHRRLSQNKIDFTGFETEKINKNHRNNKNGHKKKKYGKSLKDKILNLFFKFEVLAKKKELYKKSMTALELGDSAKTLILREKEIDKFVNIYNEVKFSEHPISQEQYEKMKGVWSDT